MDLERLQRLIDLMKQAGLSELTVEQPDWKVSIKRGGAAAPAGAQDERAAEREEEPQAPALQPVEVLAHVVGVFRHGDGADPKSAVKAGRRVGAGQVLGSIEAMKVKNEVHCPVAGRVSEVLVQGGAAVEYGQVLFRVMPEMEQGDEMLGADR